MVPNEPLLQYGHEPITHSLGVNSWNCVKLPFAVILILMIHLGYNFIYIMKAQLWCDVKNSDMIYSVIFNVRATCIFTSLGFWAHKHFVKWFPYMLGLLAGTLGQPYWFHLILFKSATRPEELVAVWLQMMCSDMNDMIGCWPKKSNMSAKYILLGLGCRRW